MDTGDNWKLLVFREGKVLIDARNLLRGLSIQVDSVLSLSDFRSQRVRDEVIDALLRTGELECALDDRGFTHQANTIAACSDELARSLISGQRPCETAFEGIRGLEISGRLTLSPPEGFCYYALHPLDYVDALTEANIHAHAAAVIGIRSIGATLSAVVRAWFEHDGASAERITVRPTGHPFDRKLLLDAAQREWIVANAARGAMFFVVDEGPGLSGSSFLAVAEALVDAGIPAENVTLLPSCKPDLATLLAENAAIRWSKFRTVPCRPTRYVPTDAIQRIDAGNWRERTFASKSEWPGVWDWTERQKLFSADGSRIFRFDGHGHYGKTVRHRSQTLAEYGWGPKISDAGDGFSLSAWMHGTGDEIANSQLLKQLAQYCAFRAEHFACELDSLSALEVMVHINLERALGISRSIVLPLERPVIADARMMPCEWIHSTGRMIKVDASTHGDDHFYPGPTDIAWDVAGAIVEWNLGPEASEILVAEYQRLSNDRVASRLAAYVVAYCAFRLGFTLSAAISVKDEKERQRFEREAEHYRRRIAGTLHLSTAA